MHGFTCGVDDLLLISKEEILRTESIRRCESIGESVHSKFIGVEYDRLGKQTYFPLQLTFVS